MNVPSVSRRFGAAALVIGPLSLVAGTLFEGSGDDSVSASLVKIAAHPSAERALVVCDLLAGFMLPAVLFLMRLTASRAPRLTLVGGAVAFVGWLAAMVSLGASDLLYYHAALLPDRASAARLVSAVTGDGAYVIPEALFIIGHLVGMLLLGIALWRTRAVPRWAAALVGLAPIAHLLVHDQGGVLDAATYALFTAGMVACAVRLVRSPAGLTPVSAAEPVSDDAGQARAADPIIG
jgi:hypothetical protein